MINHDPHKQSENYPFLQQKKIIQVDIILKIILLNKQLIIIHQMMKNTIIKIIRDFIQAKGLDFTILTNQIFSNHTHEMNKYDNLELTQHLTTITFNNKTQ